MISHEDLMYCLKRKNRLFETDITTNEQKIRNIVSQSRFLVVGAAGSIGQAVTKEIFKRSPLVLHAVDISENNLVELVRDLRSSVGYIKGEFRTYSLDVGSLEFNLFMQHNNEYDYILNLSAMKHVRSERDVYTLLRMLKTNTLNSLKLSKFSSSCNAKKYFCVSTDKAANPVNLMGASKRIMEKLHFRDSDPVDISMARFANVAFSDGSLLYGFNQRLAKRQPISAPKDVRRYFVSFEEAGELCLISCLMGKNREIFFPKLSEELNLVTFREIAINYLNRLGYEPVEYSSEEEARLAMHSSDLNKVWPCYFFNTDTSGEKDYEEFYTENENVDFMRFCDIGIVNCEQSDNPDKLQSFIETLEESYLNEAITKDHLLRICQSVLTGFQHLETGKNLDEKM